MSTLVADDGHDAMHPTMTNLRDDTSSDSEENGPRKRRLHGHKKKTRDQIFTSAVTELKGGGKINFACCSFYAYNVNYCMSITSFLCALTCNVLGIFTPWEEIKGTYRSFAVMAAVFMINQSFMFVKTIRDGETMSMKDHHGRVPPEFHFLQGAMPMELAPHRAVCFGCLSLSIVASLYGILVMDAKRYTQLFIALSSMYVLSASLNLGWTLRDRFEAAVWENEKVDRSIGSNKVELAVRNMVKVLSGMQGALKFMFAFVGASAIAIVVYAIIDFGVKEEGIGLISAGMVFSVASAWSMAQALNEESLQDDAHKVHQGFTVFFFVGAVTLTVVGLALMKIPKTQRVVLGLGVLVILDSTLNFAKVVYRVSHVKKIVKKIKKSFKLEIDMSDFSGTFFDRALDSFATMTMDAGRDTSLPQDFVYSKDDGGPPPPPGGEYGGYDQLGGGYGGQYDQYGGYQGGPPGPPPPYH